uniref:DNA topoisomerase (ATP-hydrolyzing) n=1 Tax=viral metagenome TaxID=1070528 RepID=A0A6C0HHK4_9ZZZZ
MASAAVQSTSAAVQSASAAVQSASTAAEAQELSQKYQKKTDKQHVLDNPDTYTGSMEMTDYDTYVYNDETNTIVAKHISIIPGLYKLFDEGVVNCRDHCVRMAQAMGLYKEVDGNTDKKPIPVTYIDIGIAEDGTITMTNDGNGIDIAKHPEEDIWIPEMIFGHLRTSTNYDKTQKKITGGKNGFGFKLVLIWSKYGKVETVDHTRGLIYTQEFADNLNIIKKPVIKKCAKKPYTKITFKPDYARLGITALSPDMLSLLKRRIYDIAAVTDKNIKVKYNGEVIPVKHFQQYVDLYIGAKTIPLVVGGGGKGAEPRIYEEANERWEYVVALAPKEEFTQISFVNGIFTGKGGKHVDYIINQIVRKLTVYIKLKKKVDVKPTTIKEQIMLFVRCDIENPAFDSQTKDYMNTPVASFGSACEVSDKFIEKIAKMGVMDAACALTEVKENKAAKKTDGSKTKSVRGIPKLTDANWAGTDKSHQCILILCEGDSAKAGVISGLSTEDRNTIGVYPMRGKMLNVRGETTSRIMENKEINEIKRIMGFETGKKYTPESAKALLRYGKVVFMTDQDLDGSHIKGLGINVIHWEWEELLNIPGFLGFMNTPIIKAKKGTKELLFYNESEYKLWHESEPTAAKGWSIKYYKGLGTSTAKEFKEYFANKKTVEFVCTGPTCKDAIDMAFNKKRASDRKDWLKQYNRELNLDTTKKEASYSEFINHEFIHFSIYDCERNLPNLVDGNKTSQRKIVYTAFKRNLTSEIKVAQFSGSVSELSRYHHGEASLNQTIVNMAQNFVGSNNINLLIPNGQFGTRLQGGEDSASERYIFTLLNPLTRYIFPEADDHVLTYLDDDGTPVEPMFYAPIIPMLLVNGSKGIGTGFSTDIMCYNPLDLIEYISASLVGGAIPTAPLPPTASGIATDGIALHPYYQGFKGEIIPLTESKYLFKGKYEIVNDKQVRVTELPIGMWTQDFKNLLEELLLVPEAATDAKKSKKSITPDANKGKAKKDKISSLNSGLRGLGGRAPIKDYIDMSTDVVVDFTITFAPGEISKLVATEGDHGCNGLEKLLKLTTTQSTTNMHMFDENEKLIKYSNVKEIIDHFIKVRMDLYVKRKAYQVDALAKTALVLSNKARFITEILDETIDLRKKKTAVVSQLLKDKKYDVMDDDEDYKYLVKLPMDSVTEENVKKILNERDAKQVELETLKSTTETQLWLHELAALKTEYNKSIAVVEPAKAKAKAKTVVKTKKVIKVTKAAAAKQ